MDNSWDGTERRHINQDVVRILDKLEVLGESIKEMKKDSKDQLCKIDAIHKAIYVGNGKPSIMERLTTLETGKKIVYGILAAIGLASVPMILDVFFKAKL